MNKSVAPLNILSIRRLARLQVDSGAVTAGYTADRNHVIELLNDALATELVCALRYRSHHFMANGIQSPSLAREFLDHSNEELNHADLLANRIVQLGGEPDFSPDSLLARSHAEFVPVTGLPAMLRENLVAERIAIDAYRHFLQVLDNDDPTTSRMIEGILATEEKHADELANMLHGMSLQPFKPEPASSVAEVA